MSGGRPRGPHVNKPAINASQIFDWIAVDHRQQDAKRKDAHGDDSSSSSSSSSNRHKRKRHSSSNEEDAAEFDEEGAYDARGALARGGGYDGGIDEEKEAEEEAEEAEEAEEDGDDEDLMDMEPVRTAAGSATSAEEEGDVGENAQARKKRLRTSPHTRVGACGEEWCFACWFLPHIGERSAQKQRIAQLLEHILYEVDVPMVAQAVQDTYNRDIRAGSEPALPEWSLQSIYRHYTIHTNGLTMMYKESLRQIGTMRQHLEANMGVYDNGVLTFDAENFKMWDKLDSKHVSRSVALEKRRMAGLV
jgi:hypothetical protein